MGRGDYLYAKVSHLGKSMFSTGDNPFMNCTRYVQDLSHDIPVCHITQRLRICGMGCSYTWLTLSYGLYQ